MEVGWGKSKKVLKCWAKEFGPSGPVEARAEDTFTEPGSARHILDAQLIHTRCQVLGKSQIT